MKYIFAVVVMLSLFIPARFRWCQIGPYVPERVSNNVYQYMMTGDTVWLTNAGFTPWYTGEGLARFSYGDLWCGEVRP